MYPVVRMLWQMHKHRNDPPLGLGEMHISEHMCLPWDLDIWWELNNGRTLTLYDLGRMPLGMRTGMFRALKAQGWGLTVAGSTTRYRQRIRVFDRIVMKSRALGWDDRFFYIEQSMWRRDGSCAGHVLLRKAIVSKAGMVSPAELATAMGLPATSPALPDWVQAWIDADAQRPWPPMTD